MAIKYLIYYLLSLVIINLTHILAVTSLPTCYIQENSPSTTNICDLGHAFPSLMLDNVKTSRIQLDNYQNYFQIRNNKMLLLRRTLDRERLISDKICRLNRAIGNSNLYDSDDQCRLTLEFSTLGPSFHQLTLVIEDQNDNAPRFDRMTFILNVPENSPINKEIELPQAIDPDRGHNGTLEYTLKKTRYSDLFMLKNSNMRTKPSNLANNPLILQFRHSFDREKLIKDNSYNRGDPSQINLVLQVKDKGSPISLSANMTIQIDITDVNDNVPVFNSSQYRFSVLESVNQGQPIGQVFATDKDSSTNHLSIRLSPSANTEITDTFSVSSDGVITSKIGRLDYTLPSQEYRIPIIAVDGGVPPFTATTTAYIRVKDVNNNNPKIEVTPAGIGSGSYDPLQSDSLLKRFSVMENCPPNTYVGKVTVTDADQGKNADISCELDSKKYFKLDPVQTQIPTRRYYTLSTSAGPSLSSDSQLFDREREAHIQVRITCRDKGEPLPRTTNKELIIRVVDVNDNAPEFTKSYMVLKIPENQHAGTQIKKLYAMDKDRGENAITRYKLVQTEADLLSPYNPLDYFKIDAETGTLYTMKRLDREEHDKFMLHITAYDFKKSSLHSNLTLEVSVTDVNDNAPRFNTDKPIKFNISENTAGYVGRVEATDADIGSNGQIEYSLPEYSSIFQVTRKGEIRVINKRKLDRENQPQHFLEILARDLGRPSKRASVTVEIVVDDLNDNKPVFVRPAIHGQFCNITLDTPPHTKIYQLLATDADKGVNSEIEYSLYHIIPSNTMTLRKPGSKGDNSLFRVNKTDGSIYLEGSLPREPGKRPRRLILMAKDMGRPSLSSTATLRITYHTYNGLPNSGGNTNMIWNNNGKGYYDNDFKNRNQHSNFYPPNGDSYPEGMGGKPGPSNSGRGGSKGSREFILTIGIGMVVLIFFFLVLLISYFCVSIMLQKQKERRRELTHGKTSNTLSHQGLTNSTENRHHRHQGQWWTSILTNSNPTNTSNNSKLCCFNIAADDDDNHMARASLNNHNNNRYYQNNTNTNNNNNNITNNNNNNISSINNSNINNSDSAMLHRTLGRGDSNAYSVMCDTTSLQHWNFDQSHSNTLGNTPHFHSNINTPLALHPLRMSNATSSTNCNRANIWQPNTNSQSDFDANNVPTGNINNNYHGNNVEDINDEEDDGNYTYRHFTINSKHPTQNYWPAAALAQPHTQYYHTLQPQQQPQHQPQHCAPGPHQIIFTATPQQPDIISYSPPTISGLPITNGHVVGDSNSSDEVKRIIYGAKTPTILCSSNNQILINSTRSPQLVTIPNSPQIQIQSQSIVNDDNQSKLNAQNNTSNNQEDNTTVYQTNPAGVTPRIIANSFV